MKEALRIGKVTDHRLSLVAPDEDLSYGEWIMPRGVSCFFLIPTYTPNQAHSRDVRTGLREPQLPRLEFL